MDEAIVEQHARLEALAAALERTLVVPSDVDLVRDCSSFQRLRPDHSSGSTPIRPQSSDDGGACADGSPTCTAPTPRDNGMQQRHQVVRGNTSVVPGGRGSGSIRRRGSPRKGLHHDATVAFDFSSADCLPAKAPIPYRPSFYTAQFRASSRDAFTPTKMQFGEGRSPVGSSHNASQPKDANNSPHTPSHGRGAGATSQRNKKTHSEPSDPSLLQVRQEHRALDALRQQLQAETVRLSQLAQRVRAEHAQVQRRSEALAVREKELGCRELAVEAAHKQWDEERSKLKRHYTNGLRVASAVNRRLKEELQDATADPGISYGHSNAHSNARGRMGVN